MFGNNKISSTQWTGLILVILTLFIDMLMYSLVIPLIPCYTATFELSGTMVGVMFSLYAVTFLSTTLFFGSLSDRIGRKIPIVAGLLFLALTTVLFAFANSFYILLLARLMQGIAAAATWAAAFALLADLFPAKTRGFAIGLALTGIEAGSLLGAPVGGWLYELGGLSQPFLCATVASVVLAIFVYFFLPEPERVKKEEPGILNFLKNKTVLFIAGIILLAESSFYLLEPVLPDYFQQEMELSPMFTGLLFAIMTLSYAITAPLSGWVTERWSTRTVTSFGVITLAASMVLLALSDSLWQVVVSMILIGVTISFALTPSIMALSKVVDKDGTGSYGAAFGVFNFFHALGMIVGPLIGGLLIDVVSVPNAIFMVSTAMIIFVTLFMNRAPKLSV